MNVLLSSSQFPSAENNVRALWAPVLLEPISGSYERLVVGVAVASGSDFHLEIANALDRLKCLYGESAEGVVSAVRLAAKCLEADLSRRSAEAISTPSPAVSGIIVGQCREAEGANLKAISQSWMMALSSLYVRPLALEDIVKAGQMESATTTDAMQSGDRLPFLVCDFVKAQRAGFANYFSSDLREGRARRVKGSSHKVVIDFSGSHLVANFGTLKAGALTGSVNLIKRRLWDLKVERDREQNINFHRSHEMILQRPMKDDPQVSERQQANIVEALEELEAQADQEQLRLRPMGSVQEIGQHLLKQERAA
jgi:hypothetical protein